MWNGRGIITRQWKGIYIKLIILDYIAYYNNYIDIVAYNKPTETYSVAYKLEGGVCIHYGPFGSTRFVVKPEGGQQYYIFD